MPLPECLTVAVPDADLAGRHWPGDGQPVLLVHGLSSNARMWDGVADRLAGAGHRVLAVDLRGHGRSAGAATIGADATLTAAADLAAVCAALGWRRALVAGQSWGGNVVLQLAADAPELVAGLALVDGGWLHLSDQFDSIEQAWGQLAPPVFDGTRAPELRAQLVAAHPDWPPAGIEATVANLFVREDDTLTPWLTRARHREVVASMLAHRPRELYGRVRCPVVLLAAGRGTGGRRDLLDEALAGLPTASRLVEFPDGDHDLHVQVPEKVAAAIEDVAIGDLAR